VGVDNQDLLLGDIKVRKILWLGALLFPVMVKPVNAQTGREYVRNYPDSTLHVTLVAPETVRVLVVPRGANANFPRVPLVLPQPTTRDAFKLRVSKSNIDLQTSRLRLHIHNDAPAVDFYDAAGKPLSLDSGGAATVEGQQRDTRSIAPDEEFFGFGLQFHSLAQRGKTKTLKVNADPKDDKGNSHAVVPFFLSTAGYGIYLDSHAYTYFDMGQTAADSLYFQTPDPVLDYYFCYGPTFHDLLARYTQLTGRMRMPPKWGLGFWYRMKSDWKQDKVEATAREFRTRNIPCDVVGLEPKWQTHAYSCSYIWNKDQYPDPAGFVGRMRGQHYHVNLWEHAYVHPSSPIYDELEKANAVADKKVWGGLVPDWTKPEAAAIFARLHEQEHLKLGVDGYKLDECDGSDYTGGWFFPDDTHFPSGLSGAQMHNVFGYLYQKRFHEMFERRNQRSYLLCRGMFAGAQAYPTVIYSDWYGFEQYVRAAANSGFSGVLWCPEVRQTANEQEFIRRFETVFFSPLAMINAWADGVTPWEKGPEVERIFRLYAGLRMQLMPYLYSAFWQMHETGLPVVRALVMDWPHDRNTYAVDDEFMFGPSILVAPIISGTTRSIYLPTGQWTNWWTGETITGGRRINYEATPDRLPLFVRVGSIIPMQPVMSYVGEKPVDTLTLRVFPSQEPFSSVVYDDDGTTLNYVQGQNVRIHSAGAPTSKGISLSMSAPQGNYRPEWNHVQWEVQGMGIIPRRVLLGRSVLKPLASDAENAVRGYTYDATTHLLRIVVPFGKAQTIHIIS